ncbi:MAG: hypothetical protein Q8910_14270 [Bacteroidota bacterium]|nr:hypothetical protein [Bacteroidota bacterium]
MKKNYYTGIVNRISTEKLKPQQDNESSKGFKYQVLDSEWSQVDRNSRKVIFVTSPIEIVKNGFFLR